MLVIAEKLNRLSTLYAQREALEAQKQALIDQVLAPETKKRLEEIEAEFAEKDRGAQANIEALEGEIKEETLALGESVKAAGFQAVWAKGRVSWDGKGLSTYSQSHPEVLQFRKEGEPSVSIRRLQAKEGE
jgi:protoporphyrinogen oxidase